MSHGERRSEGPGESRMVVDGDGGMEIDGNCVTMMVDEWLN